MQFYRIWIKIQEFFITDPAFIILPQVANDLFLTDAVRKSSLLDGTDGKLPE